MASVAQISSNKCETCSDKDGSSFCRECQQYLCEQCRPLHDKFTKGEHTVTDTQGVSKFSLKSKIFCEDHNMIFLHFCDKCKCLTCAKCITAGHNGHLFTDIAAKASEKREILTETYKQLKAKSMELSEIMKQVNEIQRNKIEKSVERFKTTANAIANDCKTLVNDVFEIRMNIANDYSVLELEHVRFTLAKLQKQYNECETECAKIDQLLQEKHDLSFYVHQKDFTNTIDAIDEINRIEEPKEIRMFDKDEFLDEVFENFHNKYTIRLLNDKDDELEKLKKELTKEKESASKDREISNSEIIVVRQEMKLLSKSLEDERVKLTNMEEDMTLQLRLLNDKDDELEKLKKELTKEKESASKDREISNSEILVVRQEMKLLSKSLEDERVKLTNMEEDMTLQLRVICNKDLELEMLSKDLNKEKTISRKQKEGLIFLRMNTLEAERNKITKMKTDLQQQLEDRTLVQEMETIKSTMFPEKTNWSASRSNISVVVQNVQCVVGIEIGTFSSYAMTFASEPLKISSMDWKGHDRLYPRNVTAILFDPNGKFSHFGYDAERHYMSLRETQKHVNWYFFKDFKLMVSRSKNSELVMKTYDGKKQLPAIQVYSSSIGYLRDHFTKQVKKSLPYEIDILWVLTFPSIANCGAHDFMFQAAILAGMSRDEFLLLWEQEANLVYCRNISRCEGVSLNVSSFSKLGSKFLIVDCGSCTLDITAFEVGVDNLVHCLLNTSFKGTGFKDVEEALNEMFVKKFGSDIFLKFCQESNEANDFLSQFCCKLETYSLEEKSFNIKIPVDLLELIREDPNPQNDEYMKIDMRGGRLIINNETVETLLSVPAQNIMTKTEYVLRQPGIQDVQNIVFTGGIVKMPILQDKLREIFTNKTVTILVDAAYSVMKGAVIFGYDVVTMSRKSRLE